MTDEVSTARWAVQAAGRARGLFRTFGVRNRNAMETRRERIARRGTGTEKMSDVADARVACVWHSQSHATEELHRVTYVCMRLSRGGQEGSITRAIGTYGIACSTKRLICHTSPGLHRSALGRAAAEMSVFMRASLASLHRVAQHALHAGMAGGGCQERRERCGGAAGSGGCNAPK